MFAPEPKRKLFGKDFTPPEKILNFLAIISICCISSLSFACDPLTSSRYQFLWQQPLSDGKLIEGESPNVFYNNTVIALGIKANRWTLYAFDAEKGNSRWQWSDWFERDSPLIDYVHIFDNTLILCNTGFIYAINTNNGTTFFRNSGQPRRESGTQGASGIGQWYFFGANISFQLGYLMRGNIYRNDEQILVTMPRATGARHSTPFITQNRDTMLVFCSMYGEAATNFYNKTYLTLFNVTQNKEIYTLLQREGPSTENNLPMGVPVIQGDRVFNAIGFGVQCNEIATGKLLWRTTTPRPFTEGYPLPTSLRQNSGRLRENHGSKYRSYGKNIFLNIHHILRQWHNPHGLTTRFSLQTLATNA